MTVPPLIDREPITAATRTRFKHAANIISVARLVLTFPLFFFANTGWLFCLFYLACGLSDVLDGYVARKTGTQSELGARLDSIADLFFTGVTIAILIGWLGDRLGAVYPWLLGIGLVRGLNLTLAAFKFHTFAIVHTWANKATGLVLFITPLLFVAWPHLEVFYPVCAIALLSAIEESLILVTTRHLDVNRQTIFKLN